MKNNFTNCSICLSSFLLFCAIAGNVFAGESQDKVGLKIVSTGDGASEQLFVMKNLSDGDVSFVPFGFFRNNIVVTFFDGYSEDLCVHAKFGPDFKGVKIKPKEIHVSKESIQKVVLAAIEREKDMKRKSNPVRVEWRVNLWGDKEQHVYKSDPVYFIASYDKEKLGVRPSNELDFGKNAKVEARASNDPFAYSTQKLLQDLAAEQEKAGNFQNAIGILECWRVREECGTGRMGTEAFRQFWIWKLQKKGKLRPVDEIHKDLWLALTTGKMSVGSLGAVKTAAAEIETLYTPETREQMLKDAKTAQERCGNDASGKAIRQQLEEILKEWNKPKAPGVAPAAPVSPKP